MNYSIGLIIWILCVGLILPSINAYKVETISGEHKRVLKPEVAFLIVLPIIILAGMRSMHYADTTAYVDSFKSMPETFGEIAVYLKSIKKDKGFSLLACFFKIIISKNSRLYLITIATIQGLLVMNLFRKYSTDFVMSIFLFVASTDYIGWMYNGIRQFLAAMIVYTATEYILSKKYLKAIIIILFASSIHASALIMIPIMLILQGKAWNTRTILVIIVAIVALQYIEQFTDLLEFAIEETQYSSAVEEWEMNQDDGTNILRVLVYSIPMILAFVGKRFIKSENSKIINMTTNASIISAAIYWISGATSGIFIGRLPIYVSLYGYILLPWMIERFFTKDSQKIVKLIMIISYLAFYGYSIMNGVDLGAWN